ncbi:MAG: Gfo/Idh/MocA family oxidoreductase [Planctomycetota bacterium]
MRAVIAGARRARQGIGAFVGQALVDAGCDVTGVVGTTAETAQAAAAPLEANAYLDLVEAIAKETPALVAICTPIEAHEAQLRIVADAGCHGLCDKPLIWPPGASLSTLLDTFERHERNLSLLTQWPHTLPAFYRLHPELAAHSVERFFMRLAPASTGARMLLDSMSHPLSVLERIGGHGRVEDVDVRMEGAGWTVRFGYRGIACEVELVHAPEPPRPAALGLNGRVAHRVIEPGYRLFFEDGDRRVPLDDPMPLRVREVVHAARANLPVDRDGLTLGMQNLEALLVGLQP